MSSPSIPADAQTATTTTTTTTTAATAAAAAAAAAAVASSQTNYNSNNNSVYQQTQPAAAAAVAPVVSLKRKMVGQLVSERVAVKRRAKQAGLKAQLLDLETYLGPGQPRQGQVQQEHYMRPFSASIDLKTESPLEDAWLRLSRFHGNDVVLPDDKTRIAFHESMEKFVQEKLVTLRGLEQGYSDYLGLKYLKEDNVNVRDSVTEARITTGIYSTIALELHGLQTQRDAELALVRAQERAALQAQLEAQRAAHAQLIAEEQRQQLEQQRQQQQQQQQQQQESSASAATVTTTADGATTEAGQSTTV
jgi:hypothetical protein